MIDEGILSVIGNTPLVLLKKMFAHSPMKVYAKLEMLNPGGSSKDRPALAMIQEGIKRGDIHSKTTIIESSSGNLAISLAKICSYLGIRFICVIDPKTTPQNIKILKVLNAEIDYVSKPDPQTGEYLPARINRVKELLKKVPNSYWTNQYANKNNYLAHMYTTMPEIVGKLDKIDYIFSGVSTCGTIRGCSEYIKQHQLNTKVIAVDSSGSVIFGKAKNNRMLPGLGAGIVPNLFHEKMVDHHIHVTDQECILGCRRLVQEESILAGGSSGGVIMAVQKYQKYIPKGATCVVILPDRGERYLDTVYSDEWVIRNFGDILD